MLKSQRLRSSWARNSLPRRCLNLLRFLHPVDLLRNSAGFRLPKCKVLGLPTTVNLAMFDSVWLRGRRDPHTREGTRIPTLCRERSALGRNIVFFAHTCLAVYKPRIALCSISRRPFFASSGTPAMFNHHFDNFLLPTQLGASCKCHL